MWLREEGEIGRREWVEGCYMDFFFYVVFFGFVFVENEVVL